MEYILSIDQSTSGTKGFLWDLSGRLIARSDVPHRQLMTKEGWIGHDAAGLYRNTLEAVRCVVQKSGVDSTRIRAVGISNQRETAVCWDADTGEPVCEAVVWHCTRASDITKELETAGSARAVREKTGLPLSPYYSAAKFAWVVRHVPAAREALRRRKLRCGTVDAWLVYKLTGNFYTDYSNASRTQLMNLDTLGWDEDLVREFGLTPECLPEIRMSDSMFGASSFEGVLPQKIPVRGVLGDSHAALLANQCTQPGMTKITYGTGSSIMMNVGTKRPQACEGIATSLAWGLDGRVQYVLEGNINYAGAVTQWLTEGVELLDTPKNAGAVAAMVQDNNGVYLVPAFSGLGAPHYRDQIRAAFVGMNRATKRAHLVRAAEECIAYQVTDVVEAMREGGNAPDGAICVDGGPSRDDFLMQFQADLLGLPLKRSEREELSGAGAFLCAGKGIAGEAVPAPYDRTFIPHMPREKRDSLYRGWKRAVEMLKEI